MDVSIQIRVRIRFCDGGRGSLELALEQKTNIDIQIFNHTGDQLRSIKKYGVKNNMDFSIRGLPNGIYPIKIIIDGEIYFRKLVVGL